MKGRPMVLLEDENLTDILNEVAEEAVRVNIATAGTKKLDVRKYSRSAKTMTRQLEDTYDAITSEWKGIISRHEKSNPLKFIYGGQADHGLSKKQKLYYISILVSFIPEEYGRKVVLLLGCIGWTSCDLPGWTDETTLDTIPAKTAALTRTVIMGVVE